MTPEQDKKKVRGQISWQEREGNRGEEKEEEEKTYITSTNKFNVRNSL